MGPSRKQSGFILPSVVLGMLLVCGVIVGMHQYISTSSRQTSVFLDLARCRFSAQTALDRQIISIYTAFVAYVKNNPSVITPLQWFSTYGAGSIGSAAPVCALIQNQEINDGIVSVRISNVTTSSGTSKPYVWVTLEAQARCVGATGIESSRTIQTVVEFAMDRSRVFDYAYFVNNYGWFQGSGVTANGDIRANGNMLLDSYSLLNGNAYAAINTTLGAAGSITVSGGGTTRHQTLNAYWTTGETRARPTSPTSLNGTLWEFGYDGTSMLNAYQQSLDMPFLGDLSVYKQIATASGGSIKQGGKTLVDGYYNGVGPSYAATGVISADAGCLVLDGTSSPIIIDGPVVVERDVVIKGTVKGQGVIYAGRNIHIVGNITYNSPPVWDKPDTSPANTATKNEAKDMLGLAAKGNIVFGDYTSSSWLNSVKGYIKPPFVNAYACDSSDAGIGYPATFNGDYTANDGGQKITVTTKNNKTTYGTTTSKYYESRVGDKTIQTLASTITQVDAVLYNNHAIMGTVGNCKLNGSLVCRDEAIIYSTALRINWDIRLAAQSQDGMNFFIYLPLSAVMPRIVSWQEITYVE